MSAVTSTKGNNPPYNVRSVELHATCSSQWKKTLRNNQASNKTMKIYTRTGDKGKTSLFSGRRVLKNHYRVEAYGTLDELNSILGATVSFLPAELESIRKTIGGIQADLFQAGAILASAGKDKGKFGNKAAVKLEAAIDTLEAKLQPLQTFILPGGHQAAAWAHLARTVCRRAERRIVSLISREPGADQDSNLANILAYVNRLSDYLFVLARYCNQICGVPEATWTPEAPSK